MIPERPIIAERLVTGRPTAFALKATHTTDSFRDFRGLV